MTYVEVQPSRMLRTIQPSEPELMRLCRSQTWISVLSRTQTHPFEAIPTDSAVRGEASTALAIAVRMRAPVRVIQLLLSTNFMQIGITHGKRGCVLHEALKHRVDDEVLHCLLHAVIQYERAMSFRDAQPSLLGQTDELGRTPLHYMMDRVIRLLDRGERSHANWNIFESMVRSHPRAVETMDADGNTPLVMLLVVPRFTASADGLELEGEVTRMVQLLVSACPAAACVSRRLPRPWHYQNINSNVASILQGDGVPSPLSCALLHGRSMETIHSLLNASRQLGVGACRTIVTHYREVPLHIAVSMRASPEVISKLLIEEQDVLGVADIHGLVPVEWMWIRHVLDWFSSSDPFAPVMVSRRRYLGGHFLAWHERVSNQYLGLEKNMEESPNPLIRQWTRRLKEDLLKRMSVILPVMAAQLFNSINCKRRRRTYDDNEMDYMMENCDQSSSERDWKPPSESWSLVHSACFLNCPLAMVQLALQSCPDLIRSRDKVMGRLPLHHAVSRGGYTTNFPIGVSCNLQSIQELPPVKHVLHYFPEACRMTDTVKKQLPLHIAIDAGKKRNRGKLIDGIFIYGSFSEDEDDEHNGDGGNRIDGHNGTSLEETNNRNDDTSDYVIKVLLEQYPDALERRDGITKLYPFLQAAEGPGASLNLIYGLLRRNPTLLNTALN